jgi:hypothetical protein
MGRRIASQSKQTAASSPGANKKFHASHYMKGLHEVVRRDEQAQGFMLTRTLISHSPLRAYNMTHYFM